MDHPTWDEIIRDLPAKYGVAFKGSKAKLVSFRGGYVIDIVDVDEAIFSKLACQPAFRSTIMKNLLPWAMNHPLVKGHHMFRGLVFGSDLRSDTVDTIINDLGGHLVKFYPRRFTCEK